MIHILCSETTQSGKLLEDVMRSSGIPTVKKMCEDLRPSRSVGYWKGFGEKGVMYAVFPKSVIEIRRNYS